MSIVITGTPGVGKHTITQKIAERLELGIIDINKITKNAGLFEEDNETNDVDTEKLREIFQKENIEKKIIVGHLAPYILQKHQVKVIVVLRRNPYDLVTVYKDRRYSDHKIKENTGSEVLGIIMHDALNEFQEKTFQIDTSKKTISEVTERVMAVILDSKGNEEVDWLDLVKKNNDLEKLFVD